MRHVIMNARKLWRRLGAFTLIEMLTVIAIIGILAGILVPVLITVRRKALKARAKSEIKGLATAISSYIAEFGAPPPDTNTNLKSAMLDASDADSGNVAFVDMDTPNECLVWFLTREYFQSYDSTTNFKDETDKRPTEVDDVYARAALKPTLDIPARSKRDFDQDDFWEFVDPWGKPYIYRAYYNTPDDPDTSLAANDANGNTLTQGVELHSKAKGFDLYSVGPDGMTRVATNKYVTPYGQTETSIVWGQAEDGNDLAADRGGNDIPDDRKRNDIANW
jgi:prepilin-type N-terminal cleavage/methylation domain-containing protein